jgi:predicted dehydrogenase
MGQGATRLGVIGAGGFGLFALQHFTQIPGVRLVAIGGTHREAAFAAAQRFGIEDIQEVDTLVAREDVDLVYIATPPFLHYPQGMQSLRSGKHVICEKPLALDLRQADEMISLAQERRLVLVANLMQRYNMMYDLVRKVIDSGVLGQFLHGYFENYASDEALGPDHWFWDRSKSGGIFIEHGVHFFDVFAGWFGEGNVVAAQRVLRPGTKIEEQVNCTVRYGDATVNFYHGFTQPGRMDRQEWRLLFERGDLTLEEWVPVRAKIRAVADEGTSRELMEIFAGAKLDVTRNYGGKDRSALGRHKQLDIYQVVQISYGFEHEKMHSYGDLLRAMLRDQLQWIHNPRHQRRITHQNGRDSLAMAAEAARLANEAEELRSTRSDQKA